MVPFIRNRSFKSQEPLPADEASAVLGSARALQRVWQSGAIQPLLRGKNLGLLSEADDTQAGGALFHRAATELGANIAHIRPSLSDLSTPSEIKHTARVLGRLYDAVECQGLSAALVGQIQAEAGVPVYEGLADPGHLVYRLADQLGGDGSDDDKRRFVLQALLLASLA